MRPVALFGCTCLAVSWPISACLRLLFLAFVLCWCLVTSGGIPFTLTCTPVLTCSSFEPSLLTRSPFFPALPPPAGGFHFLFLSFSSPRSPSISRPAVVALLLISFGVFNVQWPSILLPIRQTLFFSAVECTPVLCVAILSSLTPYGGCFGLPLHPFVPAVFSCLSFFPFFFYLRL